MRSRLPDLAPPPGPRFGQAQIKHLRLSDEKDGDEDVDDMVSDVLLYGYHERSPRYEVLRQRTLATHIDAVSRQEFGIAQRETSHAGLTCLRWSGVPGIWHV